MWGSQDSKHITTGEDGATGHNGPLPPPGIQQFNQSCMGVHAEAFMDTASSPTSLKRGTLPQPNVIWEAGTTHPGVSATQPQHCIILDTTFGYSGARHLLIGPCLPNDGTIEPTWEHAEDVHDHCGDYFYCWMANAWNARDVPFIRKIHITW